MDRHKSITNKQRREMRRSLQWESANIRGVRESGYKKKRKSFKPTRPSKKSSSWWGRYRKYLDSPEWSQFRTGILLERGNKCERCGASGILHVHHLTYARLGKELPKDLQVLCVPCHEKTHGKKIR